MFVIWRASFCTSRLGLLDWAAAPNYVHFSLFSCFQLLGNPLETPYQGCVILPRPCHVCSATWCHTCCLQPPDGTVERRQAQAPLRGAQWKDKRQHKLQQQKLWLFMNKYLSRRSVKPCSRLPRGAIESPSFEMFKTWLDTVWANWSTLALLWAGCWIRWPPEVPPNLEKHSYSRNTNTIIALEKSMWKKYG